MLPALLPGRTNVSGAAVSLLDPGPAPAVVHGAEVSGGVSGFGA